MATYNVSRHRKQKTAALVALEAELLQIIDEPGHQVEGNDRIRPYPVPRWASPRLSG